MDCPIAGVARYDQASARKHDERDKNDKKGALVRLHWRRLIPLTIF